MNLYNLSAKAADFLAAAVPFYLVWDATDSLLTAGFAAALTVAYGVYNYYQGIIVARGILRHAVRAARGAVERTIAEIEAREAQEAARGDK